MLGEIHAEVTEVLKERGLDARTCYAAARPDPPDGLTFRFECSDAGVLGEVRRRIVGRLSDAAGAVRWVQLPDGSAHLPELFIAASSVADVRKTPAHTAELVSQVICGDPLAPLKEEGDWHLVRIPDGYVGWVRSWHLKAATRAGYEEFRHRARHRVRHSVIQILADSREGALPVTDAVVGTLVIAAPCGRRGWRSVTVGDSRSGFARSQAIETLPAGRRIARERLAATGMRFMGIPYLWGGTTPKGFDCSGLVQRIYALHGLLLPRDSDQQSRFGRPKPVGRWEGLETGDLLFFGKSDAQISHVAMYLSEGLFLHAHGRVRVGSLDPLHPLFEPRLAADWRVARDPVSP